MNEHHDERFEQEPGEDENLVPEDDWFWSDPALDLWVGHAHHTCAAYDEQTSQPSKSGLVVVRQYCRCGAYVGSYNDSVL